MHKFSISANCCLKYKGIQKAREVLLWLFGIEEHIRNFELSVEKAKKQVHGSRNASKLELWRHIHRQS